MTAESSLGFFVLVMTPKTLAVEWAVKCVCVSVCVYVCVMGGGTLRGGSERRLNTS